MKKEMSLIKILRIVLIINLIIIMTVFFINKSTFEWGDTKHMNGVAYCNLTNFTVCLILNVSLILGLNYINKYLKIFITVLLCLIICTVIYFIPIYSYAKTDIFPEYMRKYFMKGSRCYHCSTNSYLRAYY